MSAQPSRVPIIDMGTPSPEFPSNYGEWEAVEVHIHGFENLPAERGDDIFSPEFTCAGNPWCLKLCPGGSTETVPHSDDGMVGLYLCNLSEESITVRYAFSVKTKDRKTKFDFASEKSRSFAPSGATIGDGWGSQNFASRTDIIGALVGGTLVVEVRMNEPGKAVPSMPFIPENPLSKIILNKFMDEDSADVVFEVGGGEVTTTKNKKAKTSPATFHAHRFILEDCAPTLAAVPRKPGEDSTTIPIPDVQPEIFHHLLYYAYGGKVAEGDLKANAKDIINAADKYEVSHLKLEAEAIFVSSTDITVENVMELLLFANDKHCALLKEAAMDFLVKNKDKVLKAVSFENFPGHLAKDLLTAMDMNDSMRVNTLRKRLHEKGLEIDGSREAMIALLEEHS